jgi:F-type H+-transporting ATPase subunit b
MENALLSQLGINWKLLLSQAINFFILLTALTFFVYKPVIKIIKARNAKIKEGLDKAEEAGVRLKEVDEIGKKKIKEAESTSINIIKDTEKKAKNLELQMHKKIEQDQLQKQKELEEQYKKQKEEIKQTVLKDAVDLVKKTIIKTVELKPQDIDEALIKKAVNAIKDE